MPIVELDRISKAYDKKIAVQDLSLRIEPGSMFGLLGPNGAGKTSSIRMMIGVTLPDSGTVALFGEPFTRKALARVGYLPEERGLYKKMKVLDQLVFMGELHGLDPATAMTRTRKWAERLHDPDLIIMDEPFSGLDPVNAILLQDTLIELKNEGKAILFSTHRMDQVEKLFDAISLVNRGTVMLAGTMREVKSRYERNRVIIEFEGDESFLRHESIADFKNYSGHAEVKLKDGADSQALLREAIGQARIYKFELVEPSLEEIFIQTVGGNSDA